MTIKEKIKKENDDIKTYRGLIDLCYGKISALEKEELLNKIETQWTTI